MRSFVTIVLIFLLRFSTFAEEYPVALRLQDSNNFNRVLHFGARVMATFCADTALGEFMLPPLPPTGIFDARFVNPHLNDDGTCFDQGLLTDLRQFASTVQIDTYLVHFQPSELATSVRLSWSALTQSYDGPVVMRDQFGGFLLNVDMKAETTVTITNLALSAVVITAEGPTIPEEATGVTLPAESVTQFTATLRGIVTAGFGITTARFQWGPTTNYWYETPVQDVSDIDTSQLAVPLNGLSSATTYHFRLVYENNGTFFGEDQSFTTLVVIPPEVLSVPLQVRRTSGPSINLLMGVHPQATRCVDPDLGEYFLPPAPPQGTFDARWLDPRGPEGCFDQGLSVDLRRQSERTQLDTFRLAIQSPIEGFPIRISWANVLNYFNGPLRLIDIYGGLIVDVDMENVTHHFLTDPLVTEFLILAGDSLTGSPGVLTEDAAFVTGTSAQLRGLVNSHGFATAVWFDWGTTPSYGSSTTPIAIDADTTTIGVARTLFTLSPGTTYHFRIAAQNVNGLVHGPDRSFTTFPSTSVGDQTDLPGSFALYQNYPNPFNPETMIRFDLPMESTITLKIYDVLGRELETLVNGRLQAGSHTATLLANQWGSGIYLYRLQAGEFVQIRRMVLMK